ncbi:YggS family pyridoxal phosphate-dependent enzyme [Agaribacterium haliotis]|uniref:YggS family pyridoxal phosphate-dependent enzyme n=1 Tax=Agaribacterium haliotis TaxID=2013869 RepID=UPI000BB5573C|nr:YggS family pyridoxal phosphate-dependent enzyme [Agaribacterium haliotis]
MHRINDTLSQLQNQIQAAACSSERNANEITLLGVSKKQSDEKLLEAATSGLIDFGENYLQEALAHQKLLADFKLRWHFIGPIQSNKTRAIAEHFDWVHSVDRLKVAQRLSEQRDQNKAPLQVCVQLNLDNEDSKAGVQAKHASELCRQINGLDNIQLRGLMLIPKQRNNYKAQRTIFAQARELMHKINAQNQLNMDTLSMGMSADMDAAIAEGATIVRIGSALFGPRS